MTRIAPNTVPLGEVATFERTGVAPAGLPAETIYIGLEHIERGGRILGHETVGSAAPASIKFRFTPHHVLFGKLRPNLGKIARPNFAGICSTDIIPIHPGSHLDRGYLAHYLAQPSMIDFAASRATGANLPRLSPTVLATFAIPLPSLDEQRRIAAILDHTDTLRTKRRQTLTHLDTLPQAIFHQMFDGDPATTTVADIATSERASIRTGPFGSQLKHGEFVDAGVAVLGLDNVVGNQFSWGQRRFISTEKYEQLRRYTVFPGDVLISIMGTTGRCVIVPDGIPTAINTKHICAITPDPRVMDPHVLRACFLWHPEARAHLRRQTKGSIMDGLNMEIIKSMPLPVPSTSAQQTFRARMSNLAREAEHLRKSDSQSGYLFASLQTRAFKGEL